jgi:integrase
MARAGLLTAQGIREARGRADNDRWLSDAIGQRNAGRLLVRISPKPKEAKHFYFRYTSGEGRRVAIHLGPFTPDPKPNALTLQQARDKADEYRRIHKTPETRDVRAHLKREEKARVEAERVEEIRRQEAAAATDAGLRFTVRALVAAYVAYLENKGKRRSSLDARNIFKNHLDATEFAGLPAKDMTSKNVTELLRRVVEAGHGRTAAKLRSYLRAAYALALGADLNPAAPSAFIGFELETNPVAGVNALAEFSRTRDRTLSQNELFAFWRRLDEIQSGMVRAALKLALLLGGQRPAQLLRLRRADVDVRAGRLVLFDTKGKRATPRRHELPIPDAAQKVLVPCLESAAALKSEWVFTTAGKVPLVPHTLMVEVREVATTMVDEGEATQPFSLSDLRRTAETTLASLGVSQDVRAQIQSHGLGGVQQKHYNRHDYRPEKREALERWADWLLAGPKAAKMVSVLDKMRKSR